jgi:hypothetical protein
VFPHLGSTDIPFSSYPLKAKYVELMGKDKGYNSSHANCQVKGLSKKSYETFSNDFEVEMFSPLKIFTSPFYL